MVLKSSCCWFNYNISPNLQNNGKQMTSKSIDKIFCALLSLLKSSSKCKTELHRILRFFGIREYLGLNSTIRSSVFGNFSGTKIFRNFLWTNTIRYSEIFHEWRYSVFSIRKFFMNEDLRSLVFGKLLWTKIFGLWYSVNFTLRCNSDVKLPTTSNHVFLQ